MCWQAWESNGMPLSAPYSVWLRPAATDEAALVQTITRLSALYGGPLFAPHATVQGDLSLPLENLQTLLRPLAQTLPVQRWRVQAVECSPHFFRCIMLRFAPSDAFTTLQAATQAESQTEVGLSPFPHLSLAYGDGDPDLTGIRQRLAQEYVGREIVLDRLSICHSSKTLPIADWRYLADYPLAK